MVANTLRNVLVFSLGKTLLWRDTHYWICGNWANKILPKNWTGRCYVGVIQPFFLLLLREEGNQLGIKVYEDLQHQKRSIGVSITGNSAQNWKGKEWTPQHIIQHNGPATWNPNKIIYGARQPIYNLNHIIALHTILEIIAKEITHDLDVLADQTTQICTAIFQHRMVLDYLLAEAGGICGKLDDSNCIPIMRKY